MAVYWPNEEDRRKIQMMWDDYKRRSPQPLRSGGEPTPMQPVGSALIAKAPEDGIPALETESTGTGTASDDEPRAGHAECEIYQFSNEKLVKSAVVKKTVYNITMSDVPGGTYFLIHQTKFGQWVVSDSQYEVFCKPNTTISKGLVTNETVTVWKGPAFGSEDGPTDITDLEIHYSAEDFNVEDYCVAVNNRGKWYLTCWERA